VGLVSDRIQRRRGPGMSMESVKRFIDFAAESGFPYMLLDEGGVTARSTIPPISATGILRTRPESRYAGAGQLCTRQGCRIVAVGQWDLLDKNSPKAFDLYASWGHQGVKTTSWRATTRTWSTLSPGDGGGAQRRLLIDMHSAYPPTGLNRTFPNYITQEGVMGAEYNKWSNAVTSRYNVTLPFTRMVLGPIDYTPGAFINVKPARLQIPLENPMVQTTRDSS